MFTVCGILNVKTGEFTAAAVPYYVAMLAFFVLLVVFPALSLFLPTRLM